MQNRETAIKPNDNFPDYPMLTKLQTKGVALAVSVLLSSTACSERSLEIVAPSLSIESVAGVSVMTVYEPLSGTTYRFHGGTRVLSVESAAVGVLDIEVPDSGREDVLNMLTYIEQGTALEQAFASADLTIPVCNGGSGAQYCEMREHAGTFTDDAVSPPLRETVPATNKILIRMSTSSRMSHLPASASNDIALIQQSVPSPFAQSLTSGDWPYTCRDVGGAISNHRLNWARQALETSGVWNGLKELSPLDLSSGRPTIKRPDFVQAAQTVLEHQRIKYFSSVQGGVMRSFWNGLQCNGQIMTSPQPTGFNFGGMTGGTGAFATWVCVPTFLEMSRDGGVTWTSIAASECGWNWQN